MTAIVTTHEEFRQRIVEDLEVKLYGPLDENDQGFLKLSPIQQYATGVLFPQKVLQSELEIAGEAGAEAADADQVDDGVYDGIAKSGRTSAAETAADVTEPLNLANEFSPSALGLTFRVAADRTLQLCLKAATYRKEKDPERPQRTIWRREPITETVELKIDRTGKLKPIPLRTPRSKLSLRVIVRSEGGDLCTVSAMLVNDTVLKDAKPSPGDCFFQVGMEVRDAVDEAVFHPIDRRFGGGSDQEVEELDLLYRHRRAFALGHGVAADWNKDEALSASGLCDMLRTQALPQYEVKPVVPRLASYSGQREFDLSMGFLFDGGGNDDPEASILSLLDDLATDYADWILARKEDDIPSEVCEASQRNLEKCGVCLNRIKEGIELLRTDAEAMVAFRLMNKVMFTQQHHSRLKPRSLDDPLPEPVGNGYGNRWRPFQLGFILMNLASAGDPEHLHRDLVELIWFPTGGGKTEAYLGLAAYSILLRRMRNEGGGTTVLMRYTLRLLTRQQFDRASAMIFALEDMRQEQVLGVDLGEDPISIGLWVGQSLTPNKRADATQKLKQIRQGKLRENPFQILHCPWCRTDLTENYRGYVEADNGSGQKTIVFRCPEKSCRFGSRSQYLPVTVIDDDIYDQPPTLVIGTVDKFAQIAWEPRTGRLFGIGTDNPAPELIIQDELHLISGPLGTMVGLYEAAIDRLCSHTGTSPKIVASTATIRRATEQCKSLYNRECFEYPPQGNRANDSYFAQEDDDSPGRLYVGFLGNALSSHQTALVRVSAPLLQFPNRFDAADDAMAKLVDPYGTLVWYFNTLRELGHAATLCLGDIPEYLKQLCANDGIPPGDRRMIYDPAELTSRRTADEIPKILDQLDVPWRRGARNPWPVDILLATNMIAVGVDVSRLGLMLVNGQPKGTSEYIQATSRVGRSYPGLVVVAYTQTKNRDRSHYERFVAYHQSLYRFVEPTSVTPFSPEARIRGMRGLLVALARQLCGFRTPESIKSHLSVLREEIELLLRRIKDIDPDEMDDAEYEIRDWIGFWQQYAPGAWGAMGGEPKEQTLMYPFGSIRHEVFQDEAWPVMTSMRNVDGTSCAQVLNTYPDRRSDNAAQ